MAILANKNTKVLVQGITGKAGSFHAKACKEYGTKVVAGVSPGKGGSQVEGVPVFDCVDQAVQQTGANASLIFVPAPYAADAILESADAGVGLIICITEGIPVQDMLTVNAALERSSSRLIGPNCPGIITPGECKIGIMPAAVHRPGRVGVISRSGTLTYEAVDQLTVRGIGQSTCIGIGGDPLNGTSFIDCLGLFNEDAGTDLVVLIGEIGGAAEEEAAQWISEQGKKTVVAYIAGVTAPPGKRMGHAGAIISGGKGTAEEKFKAFEAAGVSVVRTPAGIGEKVAEVLGGT